MIPATRRASVPLTGVRASIADAAIHVIARDGFDIVSIRTVAREAGIVHGTVQYWFPSRDALLVGALVRMAQRQEDRVASVITALPDEAMPVQRMHAALRELLPLDEPRREEAALWVAMSSAASTRPSLSAAYQLELDLFRTAIRDALLRFATNAMPARDLDPDQGAFLISALVNGLMIDGLNAPVADLPRLDASLALGLHLILGVESR